jgi:hypothetical protein
MNLISLLGFRSLSVCALLPFAAILAPSAAQAEFYAGASVGQAAVEAEVEGFTFDEDDSAGKLIFGYVFDLPVVDVSLETNYVDFGAPRHDLSGAELEISGLDAFVVAGLDFGIVGVFAKAGVIAWDADASLDDFRASTDGNDSAYGLGLRFNVGSLFIRTEYEKFDIEATDDVDMLSAGVVWRF